MTLPGWLPKSVLVAVALAALVFGVLRIQGCNRDAETRFEEVAQAAEDSTAKWVAIADSAIAQADSAKRREVAAVARADSIASIRRPIVERIVRVEVPAEAVPYTAPRDTLIALLTEENTELRSALTEASTVESNLRTANAKLEQSVGVLSAALSTRPTRRWWMPKIIVGYAGIVDRQTREIRDGPGVSIGWEVGF